MKGMKVYERNYVSLLHMLQMELNRVRQVIFKCSLYLRRYGSFSASKNAFLFFHFSLSLHFLNVLTFYKSSLETAFQNVNTDRNSRDYCRKGSVRIVIVAKFKNDF